MMFRFLHAFIYLFLFIANVTKYIAPEIITIIGPAPTLKQYEIISPVNPENSENSTANK